MIKIIDKQIESLDNDINTALKLIKDACDSHDTNDEKTRKILTFSSLLKHYESQKCGLELLKMEVENENSENQKA